MVKRAGIRVKFGQPPSPQCYFPTLLLSRCTVFDLKLLEYPTQL